MNLEKIGKFIALCRKEQHLTQEQLAEKLGITSKAVSKWECGKGLPDASIMVDLCEILKITVNDLLSGEKVDKEHYQKRLEENILGTIGYTNIKVHEKNKRISEMVMLFGFGIVFIAFTLIPSESSWGSIYSIIGLIISLIGFARLNKKKSHLKRFLINFGYITTFLILLLMIDYSNVVLNKVAPRFSYIKETGDTMIIYRAPLYNVYRINRNTKNEYYIVDTKKIYTEDTIPITPFNRSKSGIDNIIKYKNKYVGNNSNDGNLINHLPLSEYGYTFKIDSINLGLTVDYHITGWYINENHYLEKCLLYNSVSIFSLIDNVESLTLNFSGESYEASRNKVEELYPNYDDIVVNSEVNKDSFNKYVEEKMNDNSFVEEMFNKIFMS